MDRLYFDIIDRANDITILATALARNANYREDVDQRTRPFLRFLYQEVHKAKNALQDQVSRQMADDPTERDEDLKFLFNRNEP